MSINNHSNATPDNFATFSDLYQENKYIKYTIHTEDCPICASNDGRCKHNGALTLCMNRGKDDVPESILNRWGYRGLTKEFTWHQWADKEHPDYYDDKKGGKGFGTKSNKTKCKQEKVKEVKRPLSANVLDSIYRGLVKEIGLRDLARQDIAARGENPDKHLGFSVGKQVISQAIKAFGIDAAKLFPGADSLGILRYASEGYTCPAFNSCGQVIGFQIRYFDRQPKYTWAATNNKIEINGELELPINLAVGDPESKTLHLSEGLLKSSIASSRLGLNVLGGAGGNLVASHNQLLENIVGYEQFIWAMDAGAIRNERVMRQYLRASKVIEETTGIKVQYLWYGQLDKDTGKDIDEITPEELTSARVISLEELLAIAKDNGVDTSLFILETETYESTQEENQETPNNPEQTKKLILTNCKTTYQDLSAGIDTVIYFPQFSNANMTEPLWQRNDLSKYSEVEVITREGNDYEPWLDPSGNAPKMLRWLDGHLERLLGIDSIGNTNDEQDLKRYLGTIKDEEDPYFRYPDKLHVRAKKGTGLIYRNMGEGHTPAKILLRTKLGSLPLGSVASFGSFLDLPNADRDTEGGFLPDIDVLTGPAKPGSMVGLRSPMGKGKTQCIAKFIKNIEEKLYGNKVKVQVTLFAPTRQLNRLSARRIDGMESINEYKDIEKLHPKQRDNLKRGVAQMPKISLCLNSAGDLEDREYRETETQGIPIIVADEIETMLAGLNDPNSHYDKSKLSKIRYEFFRAIRETAENNGYVLVADANVQDITLTKLAEAAGVDPSKIVRINHKSTDPGFKYTYCDDISKILGMIDEMLDEGKKVAVFWDTKRGLEKLEVRYADKERIFVMHGDNIAAPKYEGFSENPDQWLEDNDPNLFGFNSVIGEGVSIHYSEFDAMFIIPTGVLSPDSIRQGSLRLRDLTIPRYIFANKSRNCDPVSIEYKPSEIRDELREGITETLASVGITTTPEINRLLSQHNPLLDLRSLKLAKDKYQQFRYWKAIEGGLLIAQNCTPFEVPWTKDANLREEEKFLQKRDSILVEEALTLPKDSPAFKQLDSKAYKNPAERACWMKSITADTLPGVELERWFAKDYMVTTKGRNNLKRVKTLGDVLFCDVSLAIAKNFIQKRVDDMLDGTKDSLLFTEIKKTTRRNAALTRLGVPSLVEQIILAALDNAYISPDTKRASLPEKVELAMDNEAIKHLLDKFTHDLTPYCKALGLKIKHGTKRVEKLKRILKLVGFTKVREGADKTVIITLPFKLLQILAAHRQHLMDKYNQLVADGKVPDKYNRQDSGESPTESLLAKVSSLQENDIELLKTEVKNLFGLRKLIGEAKNNTTPVIAGSEPPKLSSS